jgi:hypothetical protein
MQGGSCSCKYSNRTRHASAKGIDYFSLSLCVAIIPSILGGSKDFSRDTELRRNFKVYAAILSSLHAPSYGARLAVAFLTEVAI